MCIGHQFEPASYVLQYRRITEYSKNKAEVTYFHDLLLNHSYDIRKFWAIIKGIIHKNRKEQVQTKFKLQDGNVTAERDIIANKCNDFLSILGPTLAKAIPNGSRMPTDYLGDIIKETIFLIPVDSLEVKISFLPLKNSAAGHDDIGASLLKLSIVHWPTFVTYHCLEVSFRINWK